MRQYLPENYGVIVPLFFAILSYIILPSSMRLQTTFISIISMCGYLLTIKLIPFVKELCLKANLYGKDINKNTDEKIPESLGIVTGTVFLLCVILFQPFFPKIQEYNAATTAICFTILIGFLDDVLNLKWSIKIALSFLGAVPLLVSYAGVTKIVVPKPFRELLGLEIELALLYHLYMVLLAVFCTNSINIYAGINGLEVGQSLIISASIIIHNLVEIYLHNGSTNVDVQNHVLGHFFSFSMMMPFISTTFGLFYFNFYPSRVFVGDSFTYFSGMALVVAGILGKFSKTLMLFFIPQAINFLISLPQLFNIKLIPGIIYPCPRHRLAKYVKETGKLHYTNNGNLLNLFLYIFGDISEHNLCIYLIIFQIFCSCVAFFIRYTVANWFY